MRKIKDLCVVTRKYTANGKEKNVWKNVGGVYVNDDGNERYAIDAFFNFSALRQDNSDLIWLAAFPAKPKDSKQDYSSYESQRQYDSFDSQQGFDQNATLPDDTPPF